MNLPFVNSLFSNSSTGSTINRVEQMETIQKEGLELFRKKNQDYGDAFASYGVIGVLVRMGDKISRLQSITTNSISLINSESLRDTLIDLHNYAAMAIMLLDENKLQHRRIDEIKNECPINEIIAPFGTRIREQPFSERRRNSWATGYLKKEDKMAEWAARSSESRK